MKGGPRYLAVVVIGFAVDLGLALVLNRFFGLDLALAAGTSFAAALLVNYLLFETWAFRQGQSQLSGGRLLGTVTSALIALGVRLIAVATVERMVGASNTLAATATLILAAGLSLVVNWALVSRIFARETWPS